MRKIAVYEAALPFGGGVVLTCMAVALFFIQLMVATEMEPKREVLASCVADIENKTITCDNGQTASITNEMIGRVLWSKIDKPPTIPVTCAVSRGVYTDQVSVNCDVITNGG